MKRARSYIFIAVVIAGWMMGAVLTANADSPGGRTNAGPPCVPLKLDPRAMERMDNGRTDGTDAVLWDFSWRPCAGAESYQIRVWRPGSSLGVDATVAESRHSVVFLGQVIPNDQRFGWVWAVRGLRHGDWGPWIPGLFAVERADTDAPFTDARQLRVGAVTASGLHSNGTFRVQRNAIADEVVLSIPYGETASGSVSWLVANGGSGEGATQTHGAPHWRLDGYSVIADPSGVAQCTPGAAPTGGVVPADSDNYLICITESFVGRLIRVQKVTDATTHPGGVFGFSAVTTVTLQPNSQVSPVATHGTLSTLPFTIFESPPPAGWTGGGYAWLLDPTGTAQCSASMEFTGANWPWVEVPAGTTPVLACLKNSFSGTRTIRIQKVAGTATHPAATFSGASYPGGLFSISIGEDEATGPAQNHTIGTGMTTVVESAGPAGWWPTGVGVFPDPTGSASCDPGFVPTGAEVPPGTEPYLVCLRNTYFPDTGSRTLRIQKVTESTEHPGGTFRGDANGEPFLAGLAPGSQGAGWVTLEVTTGLVNVQETWLGTGWALIGYLVVADPFGTAVCPVSGPGPAYQPAATVPPGSIPHLVCIKNVYTLPMRQIEIQKVAGSGQHPSATFQGWISNALGYFWVLLPEDAVVGPALPRLIPVDQFIGVMETTPLPAGWILDGYAVVPLATPCSPELTYGVANVIPANAEAYRVCIKNTFVGFE